MIHDWHKVMVLAWLLMANPLRRPGQKMVANEVLHGCEMMLMNITDD